MIGGCRSELGLDGCFPPVLLNGPLVTVFWKAHRVVLDCTNDGLG